MAQVQRATSELASELSALKRLHELALHLGGLRDLRPMLQAILETVAAFHGTSRGLLSLYEPVSGALEVAASMGMDETTLERVRKVTPGPNAGACGSAFALRKRVVVEDTEVDQCFLLFREVARAAGFRAVHSTPILNRAGEILGVVSVHFNHPRRPAELEMRLADMCARYAADAIESARYREQLLESDRRKDEFLAMLAHELRNPLAPIRNGLELLRMVERDSDAGEQTRAMIERQVRHLVRLVDDLMEISRVNTGKLVLRQEKVELAAVIGSAIESTRPLIDAQGHELRIELPAETLWIDGDPVRLAQVVANLLNNAAKYTQRKGLITLTAFRSQSDAVIRVRDSGLGIPAKMLPRIFDMFTQVDVGGSRTAGGLGIGLTLARTLVQMHGGEIKAHSDGLGKGSEFTVRLPLRAWHAGKMAAMKPMDLALGSVPRRRVLVVDDNRDAAVSLGMLLEGLGQDVHVVHEAAAALESAERARPDVLFLDLHMPGMDGFEVARRLRRQPAFDNTKIIALTGYGQEEDRRRSHGAGFDRHVVKPVEPQILREILSLPGESM